MNWLKHLKSTILFASLTLPFFAHGQNDTLYNDEPHLECILKKDAYYNHDILPFASVSGQALLPYRSTTMEHAFFTSTIDMNKLNKRASISKGVHARDYLYTVIKQGVYLGRTMKQASRLLCRFELVDNYWQIRSASGRLLMLLSNHDVSGLDIAYVVHYAIESNALIDTVQAANQVEDAYALFLRVAEENEGAIYDHRRELVWVWDGQIMKPYDNYNIRLEWTVNGEAVRPKWHAQTYEEWQYSDGQFEPQWTTGTANEWVFEDNVLKREWHSDMQYEYAFDAGRVQSKMATFDDQYWLYKGNVPKPLIFVVVLGMAYR